MNRKDQLENLIKECCENSSIYYEGKYPAVKYLGGQGKIAFIEKSRMLDYCEKSIPDYDKDTDDALIQELMSDGKSIRGCESHEHLGCHYTYSFMLR